MWIGRVIPLEPPVKWSNRFASDGTATAIAKVASARYGPARRSAGMPKRRPAAPATAAATGIVQSSGTPWCPAMIAVV